MMFSLSLLLLIAPAVHAVNDWNVPCFNGVCEYSLPSSNNSASGSLRIWGSADAISDITTAAGWEILGCSPDAKAQDIRLVCKSDNSSSGCSHLYQNGAVGKVVRLPQNCGASAFARVADAYVPQDQSIPSSVARRVVRRDGSTPEVKGLKLDTNFGAIDSSKSGVINIAIMGANVPGVPDGIDLPTINSRIVQPRLFGFVGDAAKKVGAVASKAVTAAKSAAKTAAKTVKQAGSAVVDDAKKVESKAAGAAKVVKSKAVGAVKAVETKAVGAAKKVESKVGSAAKTIETKAAGAAKKVESKVAGAAKTIETKAVGAAKKVESKVAGAAKTVETAAVGAGKAVVAGAKAVGSKVAGAAKTAESDIVGAGKAVVNGAEAAGSKVVDLAGDAVDAVSNAAGDVVDAAESVNDIDLSKTVTLPPIDVSKKVSLLDKSISCGPVTASVTADVDAKAHAIVALGVAASGTLVPPKLDDFSITATVTADLDSSLTMVADIAGTLDSGAIKIFEVGIPGLDFPGILSIGPTFTVSAQAKAALDLNVNLDVGLNYKIEQAQLVFPPNGEKGGSFNFDDTPLKLSVSPNVKATGSVEAHLIPSLNLGISALDDVAKATVFLNLDASATMELTLDAKLPGVEASVGRRSIEERAAASLVPGPVPDDTDDEAVAGTSVKSTATPTATATAKDVTKSKATTTSKAVQVPTSSEKAVASTGTTANSDSSVKVATTSAQFGGCFDVKAGLSVNAGADASFFDIFNTGTKVTLFQKDFELFKKCFGADATRRSLLFGRRTLSYGRLGLAATKLEREALQRRAGLTCPGEEVTQPATVTDSTVTADSVA